MKTESAAHSASVPRGRETLRSRQLASLAPPADARWCFSHASPPQPEKVTPLVSSSFSDFPRTAEPGVNQTPTLTCRLLPIKSNQSLRGPQGTNLRN